MLKELINDLIFYGKYHLELSELDALYIKNIILGELNLLSPSEESYFGEENVKKMDLPDDLVIKMKEALINELNKDEVEADLLVNKFLGLISPLPSKVEENFFNIYKKDGDEAALDYLYNLSIKNYYFQKTNVNKNIVWDSNFEKRNIEVSINLSKPEKNNKDVAKLLTAAPVTNYPKCLLCLENLGFKGTAKHPARSNIRIIPVKLDGAEWFIQYSPFGYFYKHCIVFSKDHKNMIINKSTLKKLCDFVDQFPSFFVGSNADLPIVGGSILNHEHFQGGKHILPAMKQNPEFEFEVKHHKGVKVYKLDWYNSTILVEGKDAKQVVDVADIILEAWRKYSDPENDIIASDETGNHNTITPSIRKVGDAYKLYLILRNNRCNEEHPDGIFHAHKEHHAIKKEGIGIIEALGLFILPGRLKRQKEEIKEILKKWSISGKNHADLKDLFDFEAMINYLFDNYNESTIDKDIDKYIENTCKEILINTAVFKETEKGISGFKKFVSSLDL